MGAPSQIETKGLRDCPDGSPLLPPPGRLDSEEIGRILNSERPLDEGVRFINEVVSDFVRKYWQGAHFPSTCYDVVYVDEGNCEIQPWKIMGIRVSAIHRDGRILAGEAITGGEGRHQEWDFNSLNLAPSGVIVKRSLTILDTGMRLLKNRLPENECNAINTGLETTRGDIVGTLGILQGMRVIEPDGSIPAAA